MVMMMMIVMVMAMSYAYDDDDKMSPTGVSKAKGVCELDHRRSCWNEPSLVKLNQHFIILGSSHNKSQWILNCQPSKPFHCRTHISIVLLLSCLLVRQWAFSIYKINQFSFLTKIISGIELEAKTKKLMLSQEWTKSSFQCWDSILGQQNINGNFVLPLRLLKISDGCFWSQCDRREYPAQVIVDFPVR